MDRSKHILFHKILKRRRFMLNGFGEGLYRYKKYIVDVKMLVKFSKNMMINHRSIGCLMFFGVTFFQVIP
jgi:hypothetical protein